MVLTTVSACVSELLPRVVKTAAALAVVGLSARGGFLAKQHEQLELKDESMSTNENPLGGRGRSEEERWDRQQQQEAIEKMKKAGSTPATATGAAPAAAPGTAPAPAKTPAKDGKK